MSRSWLVIWAAAVLGFFVGGVSPAAIMAKVRHVDLRQGSGNPGATNVGRVLGVRWGVAVALLDVLKGLVPTLLALWLGDRLMAYAVGLACVLGHVLSPYLRGRGGKGVATSMGAALAVFPWFALGMFLVFGLILWRTRWVAGASLVAAGPTLVFGLERERLESLLETHPRLVYQVMRAIVRTTHQIQRRLSMQSVELTNYIYKQQGKY